MKRIFAVVLMSIFLLLLNGCTESELLWSSDWDYTQRDLAINSFSQVEVCSNDLIRSSQGSFIRGYFENEKLQIVEIVIFGVLGRSIIRFYPFENAVTVIRESIRYTVPFDELIEHNREDVEFLYSTQRMVMLEDRVYDFTDENTPLVLSEDAYMLELFATALEALGIFNEASFKNAAHVKCGQIDGQI